MHLKSLISGLAVSAAAGSIFYVLSSSSNKQKKCLKKDVKKTLKSAADLAEDFSSMFL